MKKIIAWLGPSGSRLYRAEQVFKYLNHTGKYECLVSPTELRDEQLLWADGIFLQHTIDPRAISDAWAYKVERGKKIITDFDDTLESSPNNPFYKDYVSRFGKDWFIQLAKVSDLVTVTTQELKDEFKQYNKNIHILPNYLDLEKWDIPTPVNETGTLRILWAGSMTHNADLQMVMPVIRRILTERENVKFVFCGANIDFMLEGIERHKWEQIPAISDYYKYPLLAHSYLADIAIAPLISNHFNRCKSYLKYLEYGICKYAGIYSPSAYSGVIKDYENGLIAYTSRNWYKYLNLLLDDAKLRAKLSKNAYEDVSHNHGIKDNVYKWDKLYQTIL